MSGKQDSCHSPERPIANRSRQRNLFCDQHFGEPENRGRRLRSRGCMQSWSAKMPSVKAVSCDLDSKDPRFANSCGRGTEFPRGILPMPALQRSDFEPAEFNGRAIPQDPLTNQIRTGIQTAAVRRLDCSHRPDHRFARLQPESLLPVASTPQSGPVSLQSTRRSGNAPGSIRSAGPPAIRRTTGPGIPCRRKARQTGARFTALDLKSDLLGRQVLGVLNLHAKQISPIRFDLLAERSQTRLNRPVCLTTDPRPQAGKISPRRGESDRRGGSLHRSLADRSVNCGFSGSFLASQSQWFHGRGHVASRDLDGIGTLVA
jgi:hypothetical protein